MLTTCQRFISQDIKYGHMQFACVVGADGGDDVVLYQSIMASGASPGITVLRPILFQLMGSCTFICTNSTLLFCKPTQVEL